MNEENITRELTYGEKAVGIKFNPGGLVSVEVVKAQYANIIDDLNLTREETDDLEVKRLCSIAITEAQSAQMWAVKAKTWGK
jgi:hypothetical protein